MMAMIQSNELSLVYLSWLEFAAVGTKSESCSYLGLQPVLGQIGVKSCLLVELVIKLVR